MITCWCPDRLQPDHNHSPHCPALLSFLWSVLLIITNSWEHIPNKLELDRFIRPGVSKLFSTEKAVHTKSLQKQGWPWIMTSGDTEKWRKLGGMCAKSSVGNLAWIWFRIIALPVNGVVDQHTQLKAHYKQVGIVDKFKRSWFRDLFSAEKDVHAKSLQEQGWRWI